MAFCIPVFCVQDHLYSITRLCATLSQLYNPQFKYTTYPSMSALPESSTLAKHSESMLICALKAVTPFSQQSTQRNRNYTRSGNLTSRQTETH